MQRRPFVPIEHIRDNMFGRRQKLESETIRVLFCQTNGGIRRRSIDIAIKQVQIKTDGSESQQRMKTLCRRRRPEPIEDFQGSCPKSQFDLAAQRQ